MSQYSPSLEASADLESLGLESLDHLVGREVIIQMSGYGQLLVGNVLQTHGDYVEVAVSQCEHQVPLCVMYANIAGVRKRRFDIESVSSAQYFGYSSSDGWINANRMSGLPLTSSHLLRILQYALDNKTSERVANIQSLQTIAELCLSLMLSELVDLNSTTVREILEFVLCVLLRVSDELSSTVDNASFRYVTKSSSWIEFSKAVVDYLLVVGISLKESLSHRPQVEKITKKK